MIKVKSTWAGEWTEPGDERGWCRDTKARKIHNIHGKRGNLPTPPGKERKKGRQNGLSSHLHHVCADVQMMGVTFGSRDPDVAKMALPS